MPLRYPLLVAVRPLRSLAAAKTTGQPVASQAILWVAHMAGVDAPMRAAVEANQFGPDHGLLAQTRQPPRGSSRKEGLGGSRLEGRGCGQGDDVPAYAQYSQFPGGRRAVDDGRGDGLQLRNDAYGVARVGVRVVSS